MWVGIEPDILMRLENVAHEQRLIRDALNGHNVYEVCSVKP